MRFSGDLRIFHIGLGFFRRRILWLSQLLGGQRILLFGLRFLIRRLFFGVMLESNLVAGRQELENGKELLYGQSITDACIGLDETREIFDILAEGVVKRQAR